jgi:dihydrofolate reductase
MTTFVSLDGVMQAPGGPDEDTASGFAHGGWVFPLFDDGAGSAIEGIFRKADAFLLGRTTYDIFAAHWPRVTDPDDLVATTLNASPKFVASRTRKTFGWNNSAHIAKVVDDVPTLKSRFAGELQVHGSAGLAQTLIKHGLVDEFRIFTFPVTIGSGKRLFGAGAVPAALELIDSQRTTKGIVISTYRRAGPLRTGSFALE